MKIKPVTETYLGEPLANLQGFGRRGAVSGGSQPTPQTTRMTTGSGTHHGSKTHTGSSAPKNTQKIRG